MANHKTAAEHYGDQAKLAMFDEMVNLVDRAIKMLWLAVPEARVIHSDSHNPIVAWVSDAHALLAKLSKERRNV